MAEQPGQGRSPSAEAQGTLFDTDVFFEPAPPESNPFILAESAWTQVSGGVFIAFVGEYVLQVHHGDVGWGARVWRRGHGVWIDDRNLESVEAAKFAAFRATWQDTCGCGSDIRQAATSGSSLEA